MDIHLPADPELVERRAARRAACAHEVTVRQRGRFPVTARVSDLTVDGCRIEGAGPFDQGSELYVRLPGLESQGAQVIWSHGGSSGALFARPLHPAVLARFLPAASRIALVAEYGTPVAMPQAELAGLSRRERIARGVAEYVAGPLRTAKARSGSGLGGAIKRQVRRQVDQRGEERYADTVRTGPMELTVRAQPAAVRNVSASGLKLGVALEAKIGEWVPVAFAGFPPLEARVIWLRPDEAGLSLPPESIALDDA